MKTIINNIKGDRTIWIMVFFLYIVSLLAVYSSTGTLAYRFRAGNTEYYLFKHFIILVLGVGLLYLSQLVHYKYYSTIAKVAIFCAVPLLIYTLYRGVSIHDANRWLILPFVNISFQTSDFARLALILFLARLLSRKQEVINDSKTAFLIMTIPVILVCALILPANFSTAAVLFVTSLVMMYFGRARVRHIMVFTATCLAGTALFIVILSSMPETGRLQTWNNRIATFIDKDNSNTYQSDQAKIAIATGGIIGKFPGNSTQRNYLPQAYSDFIYAIIIEEYGLVGGVLVVLFYLIILYRGIRIAHKSPGTFGAFLAAGLSFSLVFQAMINMAVAVNLLPVTGQQLPLVSMGGTSLWFTSLSIGIILSVSRRIDDSKNKVFASMPETVVDELSVNEPAFNKISI